jgi:hypothetical protein
VSASHERRSSRCLREAVRSGRTGVGTGGFPTSSEADQVRRKFGSLRAALEAAGLDPARLIRGGRYSTDEAIAAELRQLVVERPDMKLAEFRRTGIADAIKRRHGSLQAGMAALGVSGWPRQYNFPLPSHEEIVAGIKERHHRGEPMGVAIVLSTERRLAKAAYKRFGSWRAAMRAAGLGAEVDEGAWNRAQIRAELNGRRLRHEPLNERAIQDDDPHLWSAVVARYASLAAALRDASRVRRTVPPRGQARG